MVRKMREYCKERCSRMFRKVWQYLVRINRKTEGGLVVGLKAGLKAGLVAGLAVIAGSAIGIGIVALARITSWTTVLISLAAIGLGTAFLIVRHHCHKKEHTATMSLC